MSRSTVWGLFVAVSLPSISSSFVVGSHVPSSKSLNSAVSTSFPRQMNTVFSVRGGADGSIGDIGSGGYENGSNSELIPRIDPPPTFSQPCTRALLMVDSFCPYHGGYISDMARQAYGVAVVYVISDYVLGYLAVRRQDEFAKEYSKMGMPASPEQWLKQVPYTFVAAYCESDSGLEEASRFCVKLGLERHNGVNPARRDKYLMNEAAREYGLDTVKQKQCSSLQDALQFAREQLGVETTAPQSLPKFATAVEAFPTSQESSNYGALGSGTNAASGSSNVPLCVVKPTIGSGTDNVFLCHDLQTVEKAFNIIHNEKVFGSVENIKNEFVLLQEFARGTEYAIDVVSKDGHHKVAALWRYDKRPANGAPFVYHATELVDARDSPVGESVCKYIMNALDALGVKWGVTHNEVIVDDYGPRLVEVNCRQHNTDFLPLTMACIGYNAFDMFLSAYLGDFPDLPSESEELRVKWDDLPDLPVTRLSGAIVHLVSHVEGELASLNTKALDEIQEMDSVVHMEIYPPFLEVGNRVGKTIDIRTDAGWLHIINKNRETFQRDYDRIIELMPQLFSVKEEQS